jgi:predicted ArsR family transcriptional regulator
MQARKLKRVVAKEELVDVTGNIIRAILLQEIVNMTGRQYGQFNGWVTKTAQQFSEDLGLGENTIRKHLNELADQGLIYQKKHGMPRTFSYQLNVQSLNQKLHKYGLIALDLWRGDEH